MGLIMIKTERFPCDSTIYRVISTRTRTPDGTRQTPAKRNAPTADRQV
eukprot:COSAG02_NODE_38788_length_425_cov_0.539877_1_plen_47_part_01